MLSIGVHAVSLPWTHRDENAGQAIQGLTATLPARIAGEIAATSAQRPGRNAASRDSGKSASHLATGLSIDARTRGTLLGNDRSTVLGTILL